MTTMPPATYGPRGLKRLWMSAVNPNVGMPLPCPECGTVFNATDAHREDSGDPDRRLGCPNCHTFCRYAPAHTDWRRVSRDVIAIAIMMAATVGTIYWANLGGTVAPGVPQLHLERSIPTIVFAATVALLSRGWWKVHGPPLLVIDQPPAEAERRN